jgi:hypothetical protein
MRASRRKLPRPSRQLERRLTGLPRTSNIAKQTETEILVRGLAHVGIIALVDEATGYQDARAVQASSMNGRVSRRHFARSAER